MINNLIADIREYIEYIQEKKIYVSIHTNFTEYMVPLVEFNIHRNPVCLLVKSDNEMWDKCIKQHSEESCIKERIIKRSCHAEVEETVFFLECGGTVCISTEEDNDKRRKITADFEEGRI